MAFEIQPKILEYGRSTVIPYYGTDLVSMNRKGVKSFLKSIGVVFPEKGRKSRSQKAKKKTKAKRIKKAA